MEHGSRLKSFKNHGRDVDDLRRRRNESSVDLRKQKKEEQALKRRNINLDENKEDLLNNNVVTSTSKANTPLNVSSTLNDIILKLNNANDNKEELFSAVQSIRKILSQERNPIIDDVIKANLVPNLVKYLDCFDHPALQFEAAWALTNIASGTSMQTRKVVEYGAILSFIKLLSSPHANVREQSVWALGNIAGDGAELRDLVIKCGIIEPLLALIQPETENTFLRNITWTLSNLCRNKNPPPSMDVLNQLLPSLSSLLFSNDKEVLVDTCWALSYITDGTNDKIEAVVRTGVVPRLIELVNLYGKSEIILLTPTLRCIGHIATGTDEQTQRLLDANLLSVFHLLLKHSRVSVQKDSAWILSNITAGNQGQIQAIVSSGLVPLMVNALAVGEMRVQKELAWAIANFTANASVEQNMYLIECQIMKPMCDLLEARDAKLVKVLLDGLCNILLVTKKVGQLEQACVYIEEIDGLSKIEKLQECDNSDVYKLAIYLIEHFFSDENNGDEEVMLQPVTTNDQYMFMGGDNSSRSTTATTTDTTYAVADSTVNKFNF